MSRLIPLLLAVILLAIQPSAHGRPDHEALTVAAIAVDGGLNPEDHVDDWWRVHMPELRAAVESGEVDEETAQRRALEDLKARASGYDGHPVLEFEETIYLGDYNQEAGHFRLGFPYPEHFFMAAAPTSQTLPGHYHVLLANMPMVEQLPMAPEDAASLVERRKGLPGAHRRRLYARVYLTMVEFQNGRDFQAVVTRLDVFEDADREKLIHGFREQRDPETIVENRLLAEGITWEIVENHGFDYLGIRPLSIIPEGARELDDCARAGREAGHLVVRCRLVSDLYGFEVVQERFYLGARLARVIVHRTDKPGGKLRKTVEHSLRRVGLPKLSPESREPMSWRYHEVAVRYDREVLMPGQEKDATAFLTIEAVPYLKVLADAESGDAAE